MCGGDLIPMAIAGGILLRTPSICGEFSNDSWKFKKAYRQEESTEIAGPYSTLFFFSAMMGDT
jgi:hypothetical protein